MGYDSATVSALRRQLEEAFAAAPVPEEGHVAACTCAECSAFVEAVAGRSWREIEGEILLRHPDRLCFLTPGGYRQYLPAYLLLSLGQGTDERRVLQYLLMYLGGKVPPHIEPLLRRYIDRFSPQEVGAVVGYLHLVAAEESEPRLSEMARRALEDYWGNSPSG